METIRIYRQNCIAAGKECFCMKNEGEPCGDCTEYEVTQEQADSFRKQAKEAGAGTDLYLNRCAKTIEEYL